MFKGLDELPESNFERLRNMPKIGDVSLKANYVLTLIAAGMSWLFYIGSYSYIPKYGKIADIVLFSLLALYFIPCCIFDSKPSPEAKALCHAAACIFYQLLALRMFHGYMVGTTDNLMYFDTDESKYAWLYSITGVLLACCILLDILFWRRLKRCAVRKEFTKHGSGFWGKGRFLKIMLGVLLVISPSPGVAKWRGRSLAALFDGSEEILTFIGGMLIFYLIGLIAMFSAFALCMQIAAYYCAKRFSSAAVDTPFSRRDR